MINHSNFKIYSLINAKEWKLNSAFFNIIKFETFSKIYKQFNFIINYEIFINIFIQILKILSKK